MIRTKRWIKTITEEDSTGYKSVININACGTVIWDIETAKKINIGDIIYVYVGGYNHQKIEYRGVVVDLIAHHNEPKKKKYELQITFIKLPDEIVNALTYNEIKKIQPIVTRSINLFSELGCKETFDEIERLEKKYYSSKRIK